MTKLKRSFGAETDTDPVLEDWEHKLEVKEYMKGYKPHKEGTKACAENNGKYDYLVLQRRLPELKTELKNSVCWEAAASNADVVFLLLTTRDVMHNKEERV